jgi:hypothetical protein
MDSDECLGKDERIQELYELINQETALLDIEIFVRNEEIYRLNSEIDLIKFYCKELDQEYPTPDQLDKEVNQNAFHNETILLKDQSTLLNEEINQLNQKINATNQSISIDRFIIVFLLLYIFFTSCKKIINFSLDLDAGVAKIKKNDQMPNRPSKLKFGRNLAISIVSLKLLYCNFNDNVLYNLRTFIFYSFPKLKKTQRLVSGLYGSLTIY